MAIYICARCEGHIDEDYDPMTSSGMCGECHDKYMERKEAESRDFMLGFSKIRQGHRVAPFDADQTIPIKKGK